MLGEVVERVYYREESNACRQGRGEHDASQGTWDSD